jgi:hypothetical protein
MTAATVMVVALGGGQRMELFGRVLCHQPWKSGRRTGGSEEEWKEEERAQTLVLIAHKLHQLPLKMVAGACEKGGQVKVLVKSVALSL